MAKFCLEHTNKGYHAGIEIYVSQTCRLHTFNDSFFGFHVTTKKSKKCLIASICSIPSLLGIFQRKEVTTLKQKGVVAI